MAGFGLVSLLDASNTFANVKLVTNNPAPNIDPIEKLIPPSSSPPPAATDTKTSGAPFPKATRVTAAKVSDKPKEFDNDCTAGER